MPEQEYEKVAPIDAGVYSDSSGSDVAGDIRDSTSTTRRRPKNSADIRRHDRDTLHAEDEAERLLAGDQTERAGLSAIFGSNGKKGLPTQSREKNTDRGDRTSGENDDVERLIGQRRARRDSGQSSGESSEVDMQKLVTTQVRRKSRIWRWSRYICLYVFILLAFIILLFAAYQATRSQASKSPALARMMSNGTSMFAPTTIVISLDGFRADFLQRNLTPTLNAFIRDGVSPQYMLPSFPSLTFPNHFTLASGHYPESHGIVGNTFWDPTAGKEFYYTDPDRSMQPEWWLAEPFWVTSEDQDVRTAIHMWPGSEAHLGAIDPAFVDEFNGDELLDTKVQRILGWLDLPGPEDPYFNINEPRPQLIAAYVPNVDTDGHNYGPNSTEIRATITHADNMLADIFRGIDERNLTKIVNIIVVSDHGMATTDVTRLIQFEDLIDPALIEHTDGWPLYGLRPYDQSDEMLQRLYNELVEKSKDDKYKHAFDVYLRDSTMPERYHFSNNPRIAPLWIVPKAGWAIVKEHEFNVEAGIKNNDVYHPRGLHGYDFEHPLMRAIFVARGPAFPHPKGSQVDSFQNIEVYNIICDSLGIEPAPNNGTVRLPFKTSGKNNKVGQLEATEDLPSTATPSVIPAILPVPIPSDMPPFELEDETPSGTVKPSVIWTTDSHGSLVTILAGEELDTSLNDETLPGHRPWTPADDHSDDWENENINSHTSWLDWFGDEYDDFRNWASGVFHQSDDKAGDDKTNDKVKWDVIYVNDTKR